ncbi:MAG: type II CRISPR RNA-guided endonuclease Cas9, partial [Clostridiales bacterium]|nr:type II CRISPR RNA-guided endonuclease Cas9 [Clostridiales bacterium]
MKTQEKNEKSVADTEYYLGIDAGTNSVGYAVTDTEYRVIKRGGKYLAGARIFGDAETAKKRRIFRSGRRRYARRKFRLELLRRLFEKEIAAVDPLFFIRLSESALWADDKTTDTVNSLFADAGFSDEEFFAKFPTVYHLRKYLIENAAEDVRFLYLACHHIVKYRGHFLFPEKSVGDPESFAGLGEILTRINEKLSECFGGEDFALSLKNAAEIDALLLMKPVKPPYKKPGDNAPPQEKVADTDGADKKPRQMSKSEIAEQIKKRLGLDGKDARAKPLFEALIGNKINLGKIFDNPERYAEVSDQLKELKFSSDKYEDAREFLNGGFESEGELLDALKAFYDYKVLKGILGDEKYFSSAMVKQYNEHGADLKNLKDFIKTKYELDVYNKMFRDPNVNNNYASYIGSNITRSAKSVAHSEIVLRSDFSNNSTPAHCTHEDFLKHLKDVLTQKDAGLADNADYRRYLQAIEDKALLRRMNTREQAAVPYQVNLLELAAILDRQKSKYPFLSESDEYGTVLDKIVSLLTFRIPYFVGPLNDRHALEGGGFAWVKKNDGWRNKEITPWNYSAAVDEPASGEEFIRKMTNKCTYLRDSDVLPRSSPLYQRYAVLNDLSNLKINGNRISPGLKKRIYDGLMQTATSLSKKGIKNWLIAQGEIKPEDTVGKENENDLDFNSSLSSLIKFKNIFGDNLKAAGVTELCEDAVLWHTLFGAEKKPVVHKLLKKHGDLLRSLYPDEKEFDAVIGKLKGLSFSGWAKLSKEFLLDVRVIDKRTGVASVSVMDVLKDTSMNLMEILNSNNYEPVFLDKVKQMNRKEDEKVDYEYVDSLYCSPSVKRSIWQTKLITDEITKIMGCAPKKIFVEVTRHTDAAATGKKTKSRRQRLEELYKEAEKTVKDLADMRAELTRRDDTALRGDRLYLYFLQCGKCAYTGDKIDLANIDDNKLYDIDHIYPQSKIKDDSLTNCVLVKKLENLRKSDGVIKDDVRADMNKTWRVWRHAGLISEEKFQRLIRSTELSEEELTAFMNRQLVSTNQAAKAVAELLDVEFNGGGDDKTTRIVYSKAGLVSDFRRAFKIVKCREANDLHHAKDAYLNIVVGNVWDTRYGDMRRIKGREGQKPVFNEEKALDKLFRYDVPGAWDCGKNGDATLQTVKRYCDENRYSVTTRPYEKKGEMFNQTRHMKGGGDKADKLIPVSEKKTADGRLLFDPEKYGG